MKGEFLPVIRRLHDSPLSLAKISVKEIYRFLVEEVTMSGEGPAPVLKPLRVETASPSIPWDRTWFLARQYMLGPDICSFFFKLLHQILPTAARVGRILPNQSPICSRCQNNTPETLEHVFFSCPDSQVSSQVLLQGLRKFLPTLSSTNLLTLDFDIDEEHHFPLVWITAVFLFSIWNLRVEKKKVELNKIRAEMEAKCRHLR